MNTATTATPLTSAPSSRASPQPLTPLPSSLRHAVELVVLAICLLLILRHWGLESYEVPTGSMAPALTGHHRERDCPRCGFPVVVGRHLRDRGDGTAARRWYRSAFCPNCGQGQLDMHRAPAMRGDRLLVNRHVFAFRRPRRWEVVVFRLFGIVFVKRVIGLPGEEVAICGGDVYVNGELARKSLADVRALRVLVFDNDYQPQPRGWRDRWEVAAADGGPHPLVGAELRLDGTRRPNSYRLVAYRHYQLDTRQCEPMIDEYAYNGGNRAHHALVHDLSAECRVEVTGGEGTVLLGISDGQNHLLVKLPVRHRTNPAAEAAEVSVGEHWPPHASTLAAGSPERTAHNVHLVPGRSYHVEVAFVDRRLTVAVDGTEVFAPLDLPAHGWRPGVVRPVALGARGVKVIVRNFRLFRDIHYTADGANGVRGKAVHLGPDQYFVLGDNSPNSQDSRFWRDGGVVPGGNLIGKPFLVLLPGRTTSERGTDALTAAQGAGPPANPRRP
ncbi:MAG: hypothetical protein IT429_06845 [Gemmataceae bacterium]|nr:hypothetical protein [Gemmataceae bacterium]